LTWKVAVQVEVLPAASATVRTMELAPFGKAVPTTGDWVTISALAAVMLSVATTPAVKSGTVAVHEAPAFADCVGPHEEMSGPVVSTPVKLVVHEAVLPAASATVTVTLVTPKPTTVPAAGLCVRVVTPQLSVAVAEAVKSGKATVPVGPTDRVWAGAQAEIVGTRKSCTVKVVVQLAVLPAASAAVRVTTCTPARSCELGAGLCVTETTPQLSETVSDAVKSGKVARQLVFEFAFSSGAQSSITGACVSTPAVTVTDAPPDAPSESRTVTV